MAKKHKPRKASRCLCCGIKFPRTCKLYNPRVHTMIGDICHGCANKASKGSRPLDIGNASNKRKHSPLNNNKAFHEYASSIYQQ